MSNAKLSLRYDKNGIPQAYGATARASTVVEDAERNSWILAERFKLSVCPADPASPFESRKTNTIPLGRIYRDFITYVLEHTRAFFKNTEPSGSFTWDRVYDAAGIELVIVHPHWWSKDDLSLLRKAVMDCDILVSKDAPRRVQFVTEKAAVKKFVITMPLELRVRRNNIVDSAMTKFSSDE